MKRLVIPANTSLDLLAPKVRLAADRVLAGMAAAGFKAVQFDTLRTNDRQGFLYGKGRTAEQLEAVGVKTVFAWPDCPDGIVTKAPKADQSWHGAGCAFDVVENDKSPWNAPQAFWNTLGTLARANGLAWGGDWRFLDLPHCQARILPPSPTPTDRLLLAKNGVSAIWSKYGLL